MENKFAYIIFLALPFIFFGLSYGKNVPERKNVNKNLADSSFNWDEKNKKKLENFPETVHLNDNMNDKKNNDSNREDNEQEDWNKHLFNFKLGNNAPSNDATYNQIVKLLGSLIKCRTNFNIIKKHLDELNTFINNSLFDLHWEKGSKVNNQEEYIEKVDSFYDKIYNKLNDLNTMKDGNIYHYQRFLTSYRKILDILNMEKGEMSNLKKIFYYEAMKILKENIELFHSNKKIADTIVDFLKYLNEKKTKLNGMSVSTEPQTQDQENASQDLTRSTSLNHGTSSLPSGSASSTVNYTPKCKNSLKKNVENEFSGNKTVIIVMGVVGGLLFIGGVTYALYKRKASFGS